MKKAVIVCWLVWLYGAAVAQQFGGNPSSIHWQQINDPIARIIFPVGLDSIARSVAGIVQRLDRSTVSSIGSRRQKVNILLQKETTVSNGYVQLGPFRSEFYLTPAQNSFSLGSLPWPEQLAVHEFRHVQQNNNFNVGLSRVFRILFGQEGQALANSLVVPDWFYEGDAVFNETNVTQQGRGRLPFFFNDYRSLWASGIDYSWMKLRNGSLRDFTPDHYKLGYMMVAYGREQYGNDFWKKVTRDAAAFHGLAYPFQQAVKTYSGKPYATFRADAFRYFSQAAKPDHSVPADHPPHFIANEQFPAFVNDSTVIFVKSSYNRIRAFTIRVGAIDTKLKVRDVSLDDQFAYRNGRIVYAAYRPDLRWGWRNYGELKVLEVASGRQQRITTRSKYFSPDISADGSAIVAVRVNPGGSSTLEYLQTATGKVISQVPNPGNLFYTYPKFYQLGQVISAVRNPAGEMALALIDSATGATSWCTAFSMNVIGFPSVQHDTVLFTASYKGNDRLFAYAINTRELFQIHHPLLESTTGNYQAVMGATALVWSQFTAFGYLLKKADRKDLHWENLPLNAVAGPLTDFGITAMHKNPVGVLPALHQPQVSPYSGAHGLVNFHSRRPLIEDPVYSFSFIGENILNTLQSELFFRYNRNEQYKQLGFNALYSGWFPFVSGGITYTADRRGLYRNRRIYWNEWEYRGGVNIPLNLSSGRHFTGLNTGADIIYNQPNFRGAYKDTLGNRSFSYLNSYIIFTNRIQQARQHIYPRFAQSLLLNYKKSVYRYNASQFLVSGNLYLPGLLLNHNLVLNGAFHQRDTLHQRSYSNNFPFSRGYTAENYYRMVKGGVNYHFPLLYPDAGFGNIVYFLRVRANLFYDHTVVKDFRQNHTLYTLNFRSAGTEIFFDTRWWNQLPLSFGVRYTHLLDRDIYGGSGSERFALILPVNLLQR